MAARNHAERSAASRSRMACRAGRSYGQDALRMGKPPAIDILLPVFNGTAHLPACLAGLQAQTFADFRIIAVDDGSTDGSLALLQAFAAREPRLTVLQMPHRGIAAALNAGLALAKAPLVALHDHDDISFPERLARQRQFLAAHPDHVAVASRHRVIDEVGSLLGEGWTPPSMETVDPWRIPAVEPHLPHSFLLVRRESLLAAGGYRPFGSSLDVDLYWRLLAFGRLAVLPEVLGDYRVHAGSVSGQSVVRGRLQALLAQLAAISARRRAAGQADLSVPDELASQLLAAGSLRAMLCLAGPLLEVAERRYLAAATVMKLIEYAGFRPYRLERADLALAVELFPRMPFPDADNRLLVKRQLRAVIKGAFRGRRWTKHAFLMTRPRALLALARR